MRHGFSRSDNSVSQTSDTCDSKATCGDLNGDGSGTAVTDADCGARFEYNPASSGWFCLGAPCSIPTGNTGDKLTCCMPVGAVSNNVVKVRARDQNKRRIW